MRRKLLSILLIVVIAIGMIPNMSYAKEEGDKQNDVPIFLDMPDNWSTKALENAIRNGLLTGIEGMIMPDSYLTRAEMATIIVRAFGATSKGDISSFTDIKTTDWYAQDLAKAFQMGVIKGSEGMMNPNKAVTREEVFTIIARAFKLQPTDVLNYGFEDTDDISSWAKGEVYSIVNEGYIKGANGKLNPKAFITRAEFAQILDNVLKQHIKIEGEYTDIADGNIMVHTPNIILKNIEIKGDLIIGDGVGGGEVILDNVTVLGRIVMRGGNSIIVKGNSNTSKIITSRIDGEVNINVEGYAIVGKLVIDEESDDVALEGSIGDLAIYGSNISVSAIGTTIQSIEVFGQNIRLNIDKNSTVPLLKIKGDAINTKVEVAGKVLLITTNAASTEIIGEGVVTKVEAQAGASGTLIKTPSTEIVTGKEAIGVIDSNGNLVKPGMTVFNEGPVSIPDPSIPQGSTGSGGSSGGGSGGTRKVAVTGVNITGNTSVGSQLLAVITPINATVLYQWQISDTADGLYTDIAETTSSAYTLVVQDEGKYIKVKATGTGSYTGTVISMATTEIVGSGGTPITPADQELADAVDALIGALPIAGTVTLSNQADIHTARAAYLALSLAQKALVADLVKLEAAEAELAALVSNEVLEATKTSAKAELITALSGYVETDYSVANWVTLVTAKTNGDHAIDIATDLAEVESVKTTALNTMDAVKTIVEAEAEALQVAKELAKDDIATAFESYIEADYTVADWTMLSTAKTDGDIAINVATDVAEVESAKTAVLNAMDAVKTIAETEAEVLTAAVVAINNADIVAMPGAITANADILGLDLTDYNALADKGSVITTMIALDGADKATINATFNTAVATQKADETLSAAKVAAKADLTTELASYVETDYTLANWVTLNTAKTNGDHAIDVAADVVEVESAKTTALNSMDAVETITETLVAAKISAKADLATALSNYVEADYTVTNWTTLSTAKTDGDNAIQVATDLAEVESAKTTALNTMDAVKTISETEAEALAAAKLAAKSELSTALSSYVEANYTAANWVTLSTAKTNGDHAIDVAADLVEVESAKTTALNAMDAVETITETLVAAKESAKDDLATALENYEETEYTVANWTILNTAKADGDNAIEIATDVLGVTEAKDNALDNMSSIDTIAEILAATKLLVEGATYTDLAIDDIDDQDMKTEAVDSVVTAAITDANVTAVIVWNSVSLVYDVTLSIGTTSVTTTIATASFVINSIPPEGDLLHADAGNNFTSVIYTRDGSIYYNQADLEGKWGSETLIAVGSEGRMAIDNNDHPHIVYTKTGKIGYRMFDGSEWTDEVLIESLNIGGAGTCSKPDIDTDSEGNAHITYTDSKGSSDDYSYPDIMYANNTSGDFTQALIFKGYRDYSSSGSWGANYFNMGSYITVNNDDYFIMTHQQSIWRWYAGTDTTYSIVIKSNLGTGSVGNTSSNIYDIYDLASYNDDIIALYKQTGFKTSELSSSGGTISFINTNDVTMASVSSVATNGTEIVVAGVNATNLQVQYNDTIEVYDEIFVKGAKVTAVYLAGDFYVLYTDNSDGIVKLKKI